MLPQPVIKIQHAGDAVKTKAIEPVLFKPEPAIGKKKMKYLWFSVIKTSGIPCMVYPRGPSWKY